MDHFEALFRHGVPSARTFFSGNLCEGVGFENADGLGYLHILHGGRLLVSGNGPPFELTRPSLLLLPRPTAHRFEPDADVGADLVCATIRLGGEQTNPIAVGLPDLIVIPFDSSPTIAPTLELLLGEASAGNDGRQVALDRLFEYLLVQIVRHVVGEGILTGGVLAALADPSLARALTAMHEEPARPWTLDDLADVAGMSRTAFARRFRAIAGSTPIDYLIRWRMTLAQGMLREGKPVKAVAAAVGYDSPAALTRSFAKVIGVSPRHWLATRGG